MKVQPGPWIFMMLSLTSAMLAMIGSLYGKLEGDLRRERIEAFFAMAIVLGLAAIAWGKQ